MRWPLLLLALLACALTVTACGDDDVDVDEVLRQTFGEDKNVRSGVLDLSVRINARGLAALSGPVTASLRGPFASTAPTELPRFAFEGQFSAGGQTLKAGATSTGTNGYLHLQGRDYALGEELYEQFKKGYAEQARKSESEDPGISFKALGVDPRRWLRDTTYEGTEEVGGAESLHLKAGIDVPALLEDVNRIISRAPELQEGQRARELTAEQRKAVADAIDAAEVELWTGEEDKILRRLNVRIEFEIPEQAREQVQGLTGGTIQFDVKIGEINEEQQFPAPESAGTFEEFLAAVSGGTASPGQPELEGEPGSDQGGEQGGAGGSGSAGGSPYDKCVEEAGADIAKLQECAALAGG